ncbi:MAG: hypothetical protein ACT4OX_08475 [Actinomycetota bacterium]
MLSIAIVIGLLPALGGLIVARRRGRERRVAIDIDLVLEEKYPNRRLVSADPVDGTREPVLVSATALAAPPDQPELRPLKPWPARRRARPFLLPPAPIDAPWMPLPGEPNGVALVGPPRRPALLFETPTGPALAASPYDALRHRRDRIAAEVAAAYSQVHRIRTESLRRAVQAEHNAELAATARGRAGRMARESRRYEAQGRHRTVAVPDAADAFVDVHRFRVEALRRAQEAGHGAEAVTRARARAAKLLTEQRRIETEMEKATRGGPAAG